MTGDPMSQHAEVELSLHEWTTVVGALTAVRDMTDPGSAAHQKVAAVRQSIDHQLTLHLDVQVISALGGKL